MPTPSLGLNLALPGGFGFGRQVLIWGNKSAGKSMFCQLLVAMAQQMGLACAWMDVENSWDEPWANRLGVDSSNLLISTSKSVTKVTDEMNKLMTAGIDIIVVDSISALSPNAFFEKSGELSSVDNSKQIGALSRDLGVAISQWNYTNEKTLIILISQIRNSFGSQHASHIPTGGHATMFFSSQVLKLTSSNSDAYALTGDVTTGDRIYNDKIGRPVNWELQWNKLGPQNRVGQYDMYYDGPYVGFDRVGEIFDYAGKYGIIDTSSKGYYGIFDEKLHGKAAAIKYLRENQAVFDTIEGELLAKIQ